MSEPTCGPRPSFKVCLFTLPELRNLDTPGRFLSATQLYITTFCCNPVPFLSQQVIIPGFDLFRESHVRALQEVDLQVGDPFDRAGQEPSGAPVRLGA